MKIFIDCDGVLADFDKHLQNIFGDVRKPFPEIWQDIVLIDNFWQDIPLIQGGRELWDFLKPYNPTVITGCPPDDFDRAADHKRKWLKTNFNTENVITCLSKEKQLHMENPGDLLIDDFKTNIRRWEKAGGITILHRWHHYEDTIEKLKEILLTTSQLADQT